MTDKEMIDVIQENAESLRKEVNSRIEEAPTVIRLIPAQGA